MQKTVNFLERNILKFFNALVDRYSLAVIILLYGVLGWKELVQVFFRYAETVPIAKHLIVVN